MESREMQSYMRASPVGRRMTVSRGLADGFADEIASCEHCRQKCLFQCKHIQGRVQLATNETYTRSSPDYVHTVLMKSNGQVVVDNCSTCQRHCVNGCDWRAGLCERLRTTSCIHELAVQDAMHSAPIAKRVLSAIAWITHARTWLRSIPRWTPSSSLSDIMEELPDCFIAVSVLDKHAAESTVHDDKPTFTKRSSSVRSNRSWNAKDISLANESNPSVQRNKEAVPAAQCSQPSM